MVVGSAQAVMGPTPLLQQRPFRMLQFTRFSSRVAQNGVNFALVLLIVEETGRAFASSLLVLALVIPSTVAGIVSGTLADKLPKRPLIVLGDFMRAATCLYFVRGEPSVAEHYVVAVLFASFTQISTATEGATVPCIVKKEELARANAIKDAVGGAAQIAGFVILTPVALRLFNSPDMLFLIAAGLFIVAAFQAVLIGRIPRPDRLEVGGDVRQGRWWSAGWHAMKVDSRVMHAAIELTVISATVIILGGLIPAYIGEVLNLPVDVGALVLLPAAGGIALGLRIAGFLARRVSHALLSTVGFIAFTVCLGLVTFVNREAEFLAGFEIFSWLETIQIGNFDGGGVLAMLLVFPLGFSYALVSVAGQTVINDLVPLHLQGRVGATQAAMAALASSVPVLIAGAISDWLGVVPAMGLLTATIGLVVIALRRRPRGLARAPVGAVH